MFLHRVLIKGANQQNFWRFTRRSQDLLPYLRALRKGRQHWRGDQGRHVIHFLIANFPFVKVSLHLRCSAAVKIHVNNAFELILLVRDFPPTATFFFFLNILRVYSREPAKQSSVQAFPSSRSCRQSEHLGKKAAPQLILRSVQKTRVVDMTPMITPGLYLGLIWGQEGAVCFSFLFLFFQRSLCNLSLDLVWLGKVYTALSVLKL